MRPEVSIVCSQGKFFTGGELIIMSKPKPTPSTPWKSIIDSPIMAVHPDRDKPAEDLKIRRNRRKNRVIAMIVFLSVVPACIICLNWYSHDWSISRALPLLIMEAFMIVAFAIPQLSIQYFFWQVREGNFEDYSKIKESLDKAGKILYGPEPELIYTVSVEDLNIDARTVLSTQARKLQDYEKDSQLVRQALERVPAITPICADALNGAKYAIEKERSLFSIIHTSLRAVGLGEEKWDSYF
jgi:nitrogen fixation-related uncharacterized protein